MNQTQYWNAEWTKRRREILVPTMNRNKLAKVVYELSIREYLDKLNKLDIGCGTGIHAMHLSAFHIGWKTFYTGIDLSERAVDFGKSYGFNLICDDFFKYDFGCKFDCFLMLDSLEHFMNHDMLIKKILELANPKALMIVNVPLYCQRTAHDTGMERPISPDDILYFYKGLGVTESFGSDIYGSYGFPYMFAEGELP